MGNDVAMIDGADGLRALAQRALNLPPSTTDAIAAALGADAPACLDAAIAKLQHDLRPVPADGDDRGAWVMAIDERLRRLAVKVLPTARSADTVEWRNAMTEALSDLPAMVSLTAAKRAIHRPFRFIGEIEAAVREIAAELLDERQRRLAMLRRHRGEIERALAPPPALPPVDPAPAVTAADVDRVNEFMARYGLSTRFKTDMAGDVSSTYVPREEAA